ncbi:zinc-binding alcohol dehydrogenase family protein [soil metagenome]
MHAAVVRSFACAPCFEEVPDPAPGPGEVLLEVLAAGLHPRVRSGADGSHYTSGGRLPMVPGVDGVGRTSDGRLVYFVADDSTSGTMAERAAVDGRRCVELPIGLDPVVAAAAMNPAMSSWVALRRRIDFTPGQRVLVLGATGNAGQMAVQVAKRLGASEVVAAGRDVGRLADLSALGADTLISLVGTDDEVAERHTAAAEVDVVIDYLWGAPAELAMSAVLTRRPDRSRPLSWIQIGSVAGPSVDLPSQLLRSANLTLLGCGQGSVGTATYLAEFPALLDELAAGHLQVDARPIPLADVEAAWSAPTAPGERLVLTPTT